MGETGLIKAYRGLGHVLGPILPVWVNKRARAGKEDPRRIKERQGIASAARPKGDLIWFHGASVGECMMLLPLISKLQYEKPNTNILVTSATVTAANLIQERIRDACIHQYVPLDHPKYTAQFIKHWKPSLAVWAESEIWPNLIFETKKSGAKLALVNARMSPKSLDGWAKRKKTAHSVFTQFDLILAADERTKNTLSWLTDSDVEMSGNLKDAAAPLPVNHNALKALKKQIRRRSVWCAASTHEGEDIIMAQAHRALLAKKETALLILAPRHPERADKIQSTLIDERYVTARRSKNDEINKDTQIYIFDTIGEMGLAYRLSKLTFVCGSALKGLKGHNPLEPARLGSAVMTGAHIESFKGSYLSMVKFGAAKRILSPDAIAPAVVSLMCNPEKLKTLQKQGLHFAAGREDVLSYVWNKLTPLMMEAPYETP